MRAPLLYGIAGSLALTGLLATPADGASAPPRPAEAFGTMVAAERAAAAGLKWGHCAPEEQLPPPVQCATVTVPVDYAAPDGDRIKLTVSRAKATGSKKERQGALVFNPGGPGASGMYWPLAAATDKWRRVAKAYDFIGYAPRGVGGSAPLFCQDPKKSAEAPSRAPLHPDAAYKKKRIALAKAYARGCARNAGDRLPHFTSLNNARDLDVLRAALGERRLTFMGASYGTYFGAVYATLFPAHVRRMVFDSAVNPDPAQIWYRNNLEQSLAFEARWADFRAWVARHDATYHLGATPEKVAQNYARVRAELAHRPAGGKVGPAQLQSAFLKAGYNDKVWPKRAQALAAYLKGDPKPLTEQAAPDLEGAADAENSNAVYTAVECNDAPWPEDFATWDRDNSRLARIAPFETWDNAWMNLPCAYWPAPRQQPVDVGAVPGTLPPTLILAAERDAATPYRGALDLHRRLPGSALVTERDAGTHGLAGGANRCVNGHVEAYLLKGRLPGRLPDHKAACAPRAEPKP
ncbi:alpha/beta hydrolase [Streptomyces sp. NPDC002851]